MTIRNALLAAIIGMFTCYPAYAAEFEIDGQSVVNALFFGKTDIDSGMTKDELLLRMDGNVIRLKGAFVYAIDTRNSVTLVAMGDNEPRIICEILDKERRLSAVQLLTQKGSYDVKGDWSRFDGQTVYLSECEFNPSK